MRLCSIASGSSGNCIYVGSEEAHVLVDVGISGKSIEKGLNSLDLKIPGTVRVVTKCHLRAHSLVGKFFIVVFSA